MRLLAAVKARVAAGHTRFHVPGHKGSRKHSCAMQDLLSEETVLADLTELHGLDNLHEPQGCIADAQCAASAVFGAAQTHFLVNGTTGGILAVLSACCGPEAILVTSRASHSSVFNAAAAAGCDVALLDPKFHTTFGVPLPLTAKVVAAALDSLKQRVGAVLVTSPTYEGLCAHVSCIAKECHKRGIALIVDEAHGAHLGLHPAFPPSAMQSGADFSVQSTHKTLGSLTQSAMLHVHAHAPPYAAAALPRFLRMFQSSSPSYLLLCSLDAAADVARGGPTVWEDSLRASKSVRHAWHASGGSLLCDGDSAEASCGFRVDPLRVTLLATEHGMSGYECAQRLEKSGVAAEMATDACVVLALGIGSTLVHGVRAAEAFQNVLSEDSPSQMLDSDYSPSDEGDSDYMHGDASSNDGTGSAGTTRSSRTKRLSEDGAVGGQGYRPPSSSAEPGNNSLPSNLLPASSSGVYTSAALSRNSDSVNNCTQRNGTGTILADLEDEEVEESRTEVYSAGVILVRGVRQAATGRVVQVGWQTALEKGAVCGGLVSVYPPGVPVLVYGEKVNETAVQMLQQSVASGAKLVGCSSDLSDLPVVLL